MTIIGYPVQTDAEIDRMYEAELDKAVNESFGDSADDYPYWFNAITKLGQALDSLHSAEARLHDAAEFVSGSAEDDRIESVAMELDALEDALREQIRRTEKR